MRPFRPIPALAAVALLLSAATACRTGARASDHARIPALDAQDRPTPAAFFRAPLASRLALSPDGKNLAGVISDAGVEVIFVQPTGGGELRPLAKLERTEGRGSRRIRRLGWPGNDRIAASVEMPSSAAVGVRARQTRLLVLALAGGRPRYLAEDWPYQEYSQFQDDIISWLADDPDHILLNWWQPDQSGVSARKVNVRSGAMTTEARAQLGLRRWAADCRGEVRAGVGATRWGTTVFTLARLGSGDRFEEIERHDVARGGGFDFAGFSEDPAGLFVWSDRDGGRIGLYRYDLATRSLGPRIHGHPDVDLDRLWTSAQDGHLIAVGYVTDRPHRQFFDPGREREQAAIDRALAGTWNEIVSADREGQLAVIEASSDISPPRYLLYDRAARQMTPLFDAYPELKGRPMSPMQPIQFEARDGLVIHGYLTLPRGAQPRGLPTIVLPHGGPTSRDVQEWNPEVQFLASRGFAVFQLNFRGSSGYGTRHRMLGYRQWGRAMQDDITDGTRWLIAQGIADPERIGIYGASYGGYAALMGLIRTPELFRAGASYAGVTDIPEQLRRSEAYAWSDFNGPGLLLGDAEQDLELLAEVSPARRAGEIRAAVFVAHGMQDPIVHVDQAERMLDALGAAGVQVESRLYEDEVHGFLDERNDIDFHARLADFFERQLLAGR